MASTESLLPSWPDEKAKPSLEDGDGHRRPERRAGPRNPFNHVGVVILVLIVLGIVRFVHVRIGDMMFRRKPSVVEHPQSARYIRDFKEITPSEKLVWHPCFGDFRCARLNVPMDYNRPLSASKDNPKVDIALLLVPGRNHIKSGNYSKSPLLINPGGPGGSGTFFALFGGESLQQIVGQDQDIIGFDPRGIGQTTPTADCFAFPSDGRKKDLTAEEISRGVFHKYLWTLAGQETGLVNTSVDSLQKIDDRDRASAKLCETKDAIYGDDSILRHAGTPAVARDMLSIVDAWEAWMDEKDGDDSIEKTGEIHSSDDIGDERRLDTKGKLVYWGFSYGTLLGATFAAMFPDRVGRVILDGVVDADYYVSPVWQESLLDTDKAMASFFHFCHKAGKDCALYREGDSESDVQARFEEAYENLRKNPIRGVSPTTLTPNVVTHTQLKFLIFRFLYSPIATFPFMAQLVDLVHRRDEPTLLSIFVSGSAADPGMFCSNKIFSGYEGRDAQLAIMCGDKRYALNESVSNLQTRFEEMAQQSTFADAWMTLMVGCDSWSIPTTDPPMRWDDHPAHKPEPIRTSFPLLFLSNSQDPVTPLRAGVKMARKFVDAGLVEQHGAGHCSLASASLCTLLKIRAYLRHGQVPKPPQWGPSGHEIDAGRWEKCARDDWPWRNQNLPRYASERDDDDASCSASSSSSGPDPGSATASEQPNPSEEGERMMRAWARFRDESVMRLNFWGARPVSMDLDPVTLARLRTGEAWFDNGRYKTRKDGRGMKHA